MERLDKIRKQYVTTAVAFLNGVLLFLFLNVVLNVIVPARRPEPKTPFDLYEKDEVMKVHPGWREEDVKTLFRETYSVSHNEYESFTGFRHRPVRGKFVNVDQAGFRFSKDQMPWPPRPGAMNVFVFGGSTAFGNSLPDDETIASYVQECAAATDFPRRVAIYNFGRNAYFSTQEMILFQQLLSAGFVPKVALFIDGLNDTAHSDGQPMFAEQFRHLMDGKPDPGPFDTVPMVRLANSLRKRWKPQGNSADLNDPGVLQGAIDRWLANKRMIELIANGFGVRPIFVWQPVPVYKYDLRYHLLWRSDEPPGKWRQRTAAGYRLMENVRAQGGLGADVLWLADMQQGKHENLYVDEVHYTALFSKEIAAQVCGFLSTSP